MLKSLKSLAVLAVVMGLMVGCSTNKNKGAEADANAAGNGADTSAVTSDTSGAGDLANVFYFEFDSSELLPEARAALVVHAEGLKGSSKAVRLEGHADERGTREYNMALGERRANAARDFLVLQGVSAANIETVSYGEERPAEAGSEEGSWSKNRRVELSAQ
jgi:peptidoglycan-associated lipoprotein